MSVAVIVPTYGQYEYAELAVRTAYLYTPGCSVYLLDDHGPGWREGWASALAAEFPTFVPREPAPVRVPSGPLGQYRR